MSKGKVSIKTIIVMVILLLVGVLGVLGVDTAKTFLGGASAGALAAARGPATWARATFVGGHAQTASMQTVKVHPPACRAAPAVLRRAGCIMLSGSYYWS